MANDKPVLNTFQTSEKVSMSYRLEVKNAGGHSSLPAKDNAIYRLADGLARLARFDFPFQLNETTRAYFERTAGLVDPQVGADMRSIASPNPEPAAIERLSRTVRYNVQMRTTCVATLLEAGHAVNALPQTARASVNCRILPGTPAEEVQKTLLGVLADDSISLTPIGVSVPSPASPLNPDILRTVERISSEF